MPCKGVVYMVYHDILIKYIHLKAEQKKTKYQFSHIVTILAEKSKAGVSYIYEESNCVDAGREKNWLVSVINDDRETIIKELEGISHAKVGVW